MSDLTEQVADLEQRLDAAEKELADVKRPRDGTDGTEQMLTRLAALERDAASAPTSQMPEMSGTGDPPDVRLMPEGPSEMMEFVQDQVEWGVPKADPTDEDVSIITLRLCDEDGGEYTDADDTVVFIRNDRSDVNLDSRGWKKTTTGPLVIGTILSFYRLPWNAKITVLGATVTVVGVLVGEGQPDVPDPSTPGYEQSYVFRAHVSSSAIEKIPICSLADCLHAAIDVMMEFRFCGGDGDAGYHPDCDNYMIEPGVSPQPTRRITSGSGYDAWTSTWMRVSTAGHGDSNTEVTNWGPSDNIHPEIRVSLAGNLEIRLDNTVGASGPGLLGIVYVWIRMVHFDTTLDITETGTDEAGDSHEPGGTWGDDEWTPTS